MLCQASSNRSLLLTLRLICFPSFLIPVYSSLPCTIQLPEVGKQISKRIWTAALSYKRIKQNEGSAKDQTPCLTRAICFPPPHSSTPMLSHLKPRGMEPAVYGPRPVKLCLRTAHHHEQTAV